MTPGRSRLIIVNGAGKLYWPADLKSLQESVEVIVAGFKGICICAKSPVEIQGSFKFADC